MGSIFGGKQPAQDNSALEERKKEKDDLKKKNEARMRTLKAGGVGRRKFFSYAGDKGIIPGMKDKLSSVLGKSA